DDLLAQAGASQQANPNTKPDPDLKVRTALDRAASRIEGKFPSQPLVEASIRETIANSYLDLGVYSDAEKQFNEALRLRKAALGEKHRDTLNIMADLGDVYTYQGKYAEAEHVLKQALASAGGSSDNETTMNLMNNLALVYSRNGNYSAAEPLYVELLKTQRR